MTPGARRKRRLARRRFAAAIALALLGGVGYGIARLIAWPGFTLHELRVEGTRAIPRSEIAARANIDPHANVWLLRTGAIRARLAAIPRVLDARVHRSPPGNVRIVVTERTPVGCVVGSDGRRVTIDATRRILAEACDADVAPRYAIGAVVAGEPGATIVNATLARLQEDDRTLELGGRRFARLALDRYGDLDAQLASGVTIRFGDDADLPRKAQLVAPILKAVAANLGRVRAIDLRSVTSPVVEFRDARAADRSPESRYR